MGAYQKRHGMYGRWATLHVMVLIVGFVPAWLHAIAVIRKGDDERTREGWSPLVEETDETEEEEV